MKKYILGGVAATVVAVLATVNVSLNSQNENLLSDLALANVEALAQESSCTPSSCSHSWTVSVLGVTVSHSCSITCPCGKTAKCGARKCSCV
jgi:hypothetical protein